MFPDRWKFGRYRQVERLFGTNKQITNLNQTNLNQIESQPNFLNQTFSTKLSVVIRIIPENISVAVKKKRKKTISTPICNTLAAIKHHSSRQFGGRKTKKRSHLI